MKDIEFRAWLKDEYKMVDVLEIDLAYKMIVFRFSETGKNEKRTFDQINLMQFTGLCDKNGKKIFEGDIVKAKINNNPYLIKFEDCKFICVDKYYCSIKMIQFAFDRFECEVIGNVHENKELLEEK